MKQLEVYFDYLCPYCYKGHQNLAAILKSHPDVQVNWMPCEAHPRPEVRDLHSDIAIAGMYFVREKGGDVGKYNDLVYETHFEKKLRVDDVKVLADIAAQCGADAAAFVTALERGVYAQQVVDGNIRAWDTKAWEAVPSYSCAGKDIGSRGGVLVAPEALDAFLKNA